jgi:hypothetical protein
VHQWGRFEIALENEQDRKDSIRDLTLEAEFTAPDGGEIKLKLRMLNKGLKLEWFKPRSGKRAPAQSRTSAS